MKEKMGCVGYLLVTTGIAATYVLLFVWKGWVPVALLMGGSAVAFLAIVVGDSIMESFRGEQLSREASRLREGHVRGGDDE